MLGKFLVLNLRDEEVLMVRLLLSRKERMGLRANYLLGVNAEP